MDKTATASRQAVHYEDGVVRTLVGFAIAWALVGMSAGVYVAAELVWPSFDLGQPWLSFGRLRTLHTNVVDLRLRRLRADRHGVLQRAAHVARATVRARRSRGSYSTAGRSSSCSAGCRCSPAGREQGIRRARVAVRHRDHRPLGELRRRVLRHDRETQDQADLHLELVLRRADHRHRDAAHREQPRRSRHARQVLFAVRRQRRMPSCSGGTATTPSASC